MAANTLIIVADESKLVRHLGRFPLPVEVVPFGWEAVAHQLMTHRCIPILRKKNEKIFITDNGNYILDCQFSEILQLQELNQQSKMTVGVVETGLFPEKTDIIVTSGKENGVSIIEKE